MKIELRRMMVIMMSGCLFSLGLLAEIKGEPKVTPQILKQSQQISKKQYIAGVLSGDIAKDSEDNEAERERRSEMRSKRDAEQNREFRISKINTTVSFNKKLSVNRNLAQKAVISDEASGDLRYLPHIAFSDGWIGQITIKNDSAYFSSVTLRFNDPDGYMENVEFYVDDDSTLYMGNDLLVELYPYQSIAIDLVDSEYGYKHVSVTMWGDTDAFSIGANYMRYMDDEYGSMPVSGFAVNAPYSYELGEGYEMNSRMGFDPYSDYWVTGGFALFNPNEYYMDVVIEMRDENGYTVGSFLVIENIPPFGKFVSTLDAEYLFGDVSCPVATFEFQGFYAGSSDRMFFSMIGGKFKGLASISLPMTGFVYY